MNANIFLDKHTNEVFYNVIPLTGTILNRDMMTDKYFFK